MYLLRLKCTNNNIWFSLTFLFSRMVSFSFKWRLTCWIKLEMLKQSKIILKSLTSFRWHPYWSCFIRSLRNVRLNKIFERTYQDGTGVGLFVDKERGVFRTNRCTYHMEKELVWPHYGVRGRDVAETEGAWGWMVGPVGGLVGCDVGW